MAGLGHHGKLQIAEQHDRRRPDLPEAAEDRRVLPLQVADLEPGRDRAAEHRLDDVAAARGRHRPQPQQHQPVAVVSRDQRAGFGEVRVAGRPRIVVGARGEQGESHCPFGMADGEAEHGVGATAVADCDRALDADAVQQRRQVARVGERLRRTRRAPEAPPVIADHPEPVTQQRHERGPEAGVRPVTVDEHHRCPVPARVLRPQCAARNRHLHTRECTRSAAGACSRRSTRLTRSSQVRTAPMELSL